MRYSIPSRLPALAAFLVAAAFAPGANAQFQPSDPRKAISDELSDRHELIQLYQKIQSERVAAGLGRSDYNIADKRDAAMEFLSQDRPEEEQALIARAVKRAYEKDPTDWETLRLALRCAEVGVDHPTVLQIAHKLVYETPKLFEDGANVPKNHPLLGDDQRDWGAALMSVASGMRIIAFRGAKRDAEELIRQTKAETFGMEGEDHRPYDNSNVRFWLRYQALNALQFLPIDKAIDAYERVTEDYSGQAEVTGHDNTYAQIMWQAVQYNLVEMLRERDQEEPVTGLPLLRFQDN